MAAKSIKIRKTLAINPATRVVKSKKIYKRLKVKRELRNILDNLNEH